jgi:drug/metabolite transporter (DMT)-like permease
MPLIALALALFAAVLHASWNYLAKASRDTIAFMWWAVLVGAIGYGIYITFTASINLPMDVWRFYALSIIAEAGYFFTLVRGYRHGDLSVVYPISRGSPPIFIALWSALFLGERLPLGGYVGLFLMVTGIYVASLQPNSRYRFLPPRSPAVVWALASGIFIAIYSLSDKMVVKAMDPLVYNWWVYAGNAVTWSALVWSPSRGQGNIMELRANGWRILAGAVSTVGAYVAVLIALTMTSASYVVAARGTSVVIGALLGTVFLKEGFGHWRIIGALLLVIGLMAITFAQ